MSLTAQVRDELAHLPTAGTCCQRAETSAALRLGAAFHRRGGDEEGFGLLLETTNGAIARRLHQNLRALVAVRPEVEVLEPRGLQQSRIYRLIVSPEAREGLAGLGVVDDRGHPVERVEASLVGRDCDQAAYIRGALLVAGSVSDPRRTPHLEIAAKGRAIADDLAALLHAVGAPSARPSAHRDGWRVVVKTGDEVGVVLARTGAHTSFLAFDHGRLRRELRGAANRAANADRANLDRSVMASGRQTEAIERAVTRMGWDGLPDDLRAVALVRLANPEASLAELGGLLDPPLGKSAVHRRMQRLLELADMSGDAAPPDSS